LLVGVVTSHLRSGNFVSYDTHAQEQARETTKAVCGALKELGHHVEVIEAGPSLLMDLEKVRPDVVFNIATGYRTKKEQANIAAILELSGLPFTGSGFMAHVVGLGKHLAKMVFQMHEVPTPRFVMVDSVTRPARTSFSGLRFPAIVKPSSEGSSVGISRESVVGNPEELWPAVRKVLAEFGPPCLVEEFIAGREFTVALLGYPEPEVLPVEEIVFDDDGMYTYSVKSRDKVRPVCPADLEDDLNKTVQDIAKRAFMAVGCRDIARVDIRLDDDGVPYVLEINTLPGLMPGYSEVPRIAQAQGMTYAELIGRILQGALARASSAGK